MKASQRDSSTAAADTRRERERIREEKELQRIMGASGNSISTTTTAGTVPAAVMSSTSVKPIKLVAKPGFQKIGTVNAAASGSGGWKKVGGPAATTTVSAQLNWIDNGLADYDPAHPTPA
jgi:hypothetical protein